VREGLPLSIQAWQQTGGLRFASGQDRSGAMQHIPELRLGRFPAGFAIAYSTFSERQQKQDRDEIA